jgi:hypothetical protein
VLRRRDGVGDQTSAAAQAFEDREVWREAHAMVVEVYHATRGLPEDERFGLIRANRL